MAEFRYTAKRSMLPNHIVDQSYTIEIGVTDAVPARRVDKTERRAKGGATETLYHHADDELSLTFEPVNGDRLNQLKEFLNSTESGESFDMRLYGTEPTFTTVKRADEGYSMPAFIRVGSERGDMLQVAITVRAV